MELVCKWPPRIRRPRSKAGCAVKVIYVEMHMQEVIKGYYTDIKHREQQLQPHAAVEV